MRTLKGVSVVSLRVLAAVLVAVFFFSQLSLLGTPSLLNVHHQEHKTLRNLSRFMRYHELADQVKQVAEQVQYPFTTAYSKATVVERANPWFRPIKVCKRTCCVESVAMSLDQDDHQIINTIDGLDLADVVLQHYASGNYLEFFAPTMSQAIIPCLQPGTIFHLDNHAITMNYFFERLRPQIEVPYVLITGESDANSPENSHQAERLSTDDLLIKWFGTNPDLKVVERHKGRDKFEPYPLGLSKHHQQDRYLSRYLSLNNYSNPFLSKGRWTSRLLELLSANETTEMLFVMFSNFEYAKHRKAVYDALCQNRTTKSMDGISCSLERHDPHDVYVAASKYLFGMSPPGAGNIFGVPTCCILSHEKSSHMF